MGHKRKLINLQKRQHNYKENANIQFQKDVIDNFLLQNLSEIDHSQLDCIKCFLPNIVRNTIEAESEHFY